MALDHHFLENYPEAEQHTEVENLRNQLIYEEVTKTNTIEKLESLEFDDPYDKLRYCEAGDNQIAGVGDGFERNSPPWTETVKSLWPDFPVFGSIIECNECLTRLIGPENNMLWIGMEPDRMGKVINRIGQFYLTVRAPDRDTKDRV